MSIGRPSLAPVLYAARQPASPGSEYKCTCMRMVNRLTGCGRAACHYVMRASTDLLRPRLTPLFAVTQFKSQFCLSESINITGFQFIADEAIAGSPK